MNALKYFTKVKYVRGCGCQIVGASKTSWKLNIQGATPVMSQI